MVCERHSFLVRRGRRGPVQEALGWWDTSVWPPAVGRWARGSCGRPFTHPSSCQPLLLPLLQRSGGTARLTTALASGRRRVPGELGRVHLSIRDRRIAAWE